jgi:hypothetical protein
MRVHHATTKYTFKGCSKLMKLDLAQKLDLNPEDSGPWGVSNNRKPKG